MGVVRSAASELGWLLLVCVRGVVILPFLLASVPAWLVGLALWPFAALLRRSVPTNPLYYSRWATFLMDALGTRVLPVPTTPWPWRIDVRNSKATSWSDFVDLPSGGGGGC